MIRTLLASAVVCVASIAVAGDCSSAAATAAKSGGCSGAAVTTVANTEKSGSCSTPCDSTKAAVTTVANTEKAGDCSTPCAAGATAMTVANAADKAGKSGSCSTPCSGEGATMTMVADSGKAGDCAAVCDGSKAAKVSLVSAMPKMSYRVNGADLCCPKMAREKASTDKADVHFVVDGHEFASKSEAIDAHQAQLQAFMMDLVRIQYAVDGECVPCPDKAKEMASSCSSKTMQYKVGPAVFNSADEAIRASIMAWNAAQKVSMEYAVGDKTTACAVGAKDMAAKAECSVDYVVNGQRTKCSKEAGYLKTVASVESALKALETAAGADA